MKTLFAVIVASYMLASNCLAESKQTVCWQMPIVEQKEQQTPAINDQEEKEKAPQQQIARRGCCSWHGGVCGCSSDGRVVCCDGTYSPSCTCHHEDNGKTAN